MPSPTERSLAHLRKRGWSVCIGERWIPHCKQRKDLFGFGDLLACKPDEEDACIALVQTTSRSNMAARRNKIQASTEARMWKAAGGFIILHGWDGRRLVEEYL